jgi:hypothetical protein
MRGRILLMVGLLGVIGAGLIGVAAAADGSSRAPAPQLWGLRAVTPAPLSIPHVAHAKTLVVYLEAATSSYVDNPPTGTSQGDELTVEGRLAGLHGSTAGRLEVHEVVTGMGPESGGRIQLTFTALLAGGQISGVGAIGLNQARTPALAIVGGTGKYLHARGGEVFVHAGPHRTRLTFLLLS